MVVLKIFAGLKTLRRIWRVILFRAVVGQCGKNLKIFGSIVFESPEKISVGNNCYFNHGVALLARETITIGDGVVLSPYVVVSTMAQDIRVKNPPYGHIIKPVSIGNRAWIGTGAKILQGVTIGEGAVIAAGAVVTKDVPARSLAAGVPAVIKRQLDDFEYDHKDDR